jgi:ABC-type glycerol-3-phosphate transport system permease component
VDPAARLCGLGGLPPPEFTTRFSLFAPLTLDNFRPRLGGGAVRALLPQHLLLVTLVLACQLVLCTLAAYAFARFDFRGRDIAFALSGAAHDHAGRLIVENYRTMGRLGILDSIPRDRPPYVASAFGIFLLRQTFKPSRRSSTTRRASRARAAAGAARRSKCPSRARSTSPTASSR